MSARYRSWASVFTVTLLSDQFFKELVRQQLPVGKALALWPGVFQISHVENTGMAFSMLEQLPAVWMVVLTGGLILFLGAMALRALPDLPLASVWAVGFILGGAVGNWLDRLRQGTVTDYLDVVGIHYPVFNLADALIFLGACLLITQYVRFFRQSPEPPHPPGP